MAIEGITTSQMRRAPRGAIYVWLNSSMSYPRKLAKDLGRDDLRIVPPAFFDSRSHIWDSTRAVVLDHATVLNSEQLRSYEEYTAYLRRRHAP
jgi:hypothetical protein